MDAAGNFYGTTHDGPFPGGYGTVFKLDTAGQMTVLHIFSGIDVGGDGAYPNGGLVRDSAGNLYGTTNQGGLANYYGTVFKVDSSGKETVLHSFRDYSAYDPDGSLPVSGVIIDAAGNLYGTTSAGGAIGGGTVFKLSGITGTGTSLSGVYLLLLN